MMALPTAGRRVFAESDGYRLFCRLQAVVGNQLRPNEIAELAAGDLSLVDQLPTPARMAVMALVDPSAETLGQLESIVGATLDYVPVGFLNRALNATASVVRVIDTRRSAIGTGVMVSRRLLLTNHHVTPDVGQASAQLAQFRYELEIDGTERPTTEFLLNPDELLLTSPVDQLDFTLIALGERTGGTANIDEFGHAGLSAAPDKHAIGDFVTLIQHPSGDYKQIALRENRVIGRGRSGTTLHYTADTLGGSSGSPVYNDQFELIALHHSGGPRNESVLDDGRPIPSASNEGIRISAIVEHLRSIVDSLPSVQRDLLVAALDAPSAAPASVPRLESLTGPLSPYDASWRTASNFIPLADGRWSVQVILPAELIGNESLIRAQQVQAGLPMQTELTTSHISSASALPRAEVAVGNVLQGNGMLPAALPEVSGASRVQAPSGVNNRLAPRLPASYAARRGYASNFLGPSVPLPRLLPSAWATAAVPISSTGTDGIELRYSHFSVVQDAARRMPFFAAVNIYGSRARLGRELTNYTTSPDRWFPDPRLRDTDQLDRTLFNGKQVPYLRPGFLIRPQDAGWGNASIAQQASGDAYHLTNCSPYVLNFNQRAQLWNGVGDYLITAGKALGNRATIFVGPIFAAADPNRGAPTLPAGFWKVVVYLNPTNRLRAAAFVVDLSQTAPSEWSGGSLEQGQGRLSNIAQLQVSVAELERRIPLLFGILPGADTAAANASSWSVTKYDDCAW